MTTKPTQLQEREQWPSLPYEEWKTTRDTLHMWMQIVGKVKLARAPFLNQWWEVALHITPRGMTTGPIPYDYEVFAIDFDFLTHMLVIRTSHGKEETMSLQARPVAAFYTEFMDRLNALGIQVAIHAVPTEVPHPIPFEQDTAHSSYDSEYVTRWWQIQLRLYSIFERFRTPFRGKSSPIHFFWGSFDLNGTRFSGKTATPPAMSGELGKIMRFAENEENFAFGFWPGDERHPHPALYSYIYPAPPGVETMNMGPIGAYFHTQLAECILPYEDVSKAADAEKMILHFLETTYTESATLAGWDIKALEGPIPPQFT